MDNDVDLLGSLGPSEAKQERSKSEARAQLFFGKQRFQKIRRCKYNIEDLIWSLQRIWVDKTMVRTGEECCHIWHLWWSVLRSFGGGCDVLPHSSKDSYAWVWPLHHLGKKRLQVLSRPSSISSESSSNVFLLYVFLCLSCHGVLSASQNRLAWSCMSHFCRFCFALRLSLRLSLFLCGLIFMLQPCRLRRRSQFRPSWDTRFNLFNAEKSNEQQQGIS